MEIKADALKTLTIEKNFEEYLEKLKCQFLSCYAVKNIQWERLPQNLTWEQQEILLKNTLCHELNKLYPIKLDYQVNFMKHLIQILDQKCGGEVHDEIYNEYCRVQQQQNDNLTDEYIYKHYLLPKFNVHLTVQESKSFVSNGTTGLCTWQASLALADFLLCNQQYINNKNVIELGAGTGLCGMILMRICGMANKMALTDGSVQCIELMCSNIKRNFQNTIQQKDGFFKLNKNQMLGAFHLPWEQAEEFQFSENFKPDLILAADVVYDDSLLEDLMNAIDVVFEKASKDIKMLLAATVRNETTLETFLKLVSRKYLTKQCCIKPESESHLQWDRTTSVRIFEIVPKQGTFT